MGTKKEAIVKRVKLAWDAKTKTLGLYTPKRFIVMASTAQVSSRLRRANKRFMNVAVVETDEQALPAMISPRARHLIRVVKHYGALAASTKGPGASPFNDAMVAAVAMVDELNKEYYAAKQRQEDMECGS